MPENSIDRAKIAISAKSDSDLARWLDVATSVISGYRRRETVPLEQCIKIAERTGVSLDWLILGKGQMQPENGQDAPAAEYDDADAAWIPLYDVRLSAGGGLDVFGEHVEQHLPFSRAWLRQEGLYAKDLVCAWVDGSSMTPTLNPSDIVLINRAQLNGDGVFAVRMGNALRVKRLQWLADGSLSINSDNPAYQNEQINPAELDGQFAILGECHTRIGGIL